MAFHDPIDAIAWALEVQHKLLLLPWPEELLTQADSMEEWTPPSLAKQAMLFKGLRVRMAMHTGIPDALQVQIYTLLRCLYLQSLQGTPAAFWIIRTQAVTVPI